MLNKSLSWTWPPEQPLVVTLHPSVTGWTVTRTYHYGQQLETQSCHQYQDHILPAIWTITASQHLWDGQQVQIGLLANLIFLHANQLKLHLHPSCLTVFLTHSQPHPECSGGQLTYVSINTTASKPLPSKIDTYESSSGIRNGNHPTLAMPPRADYPHIEFMINPCGANWLVFRHNNNDLHGRQRPAD